MFVRSKSTPRFSSRLTIRPELEHLLGMLVIKVKSLAPEAIVFIVAIPSFCMVCVLPVLGVFNAGPVEPNRVKKGWLGAGWRLMVLIERG